MPLRVNFAGVMPVIFAQAILMFPQRIFQTLGSRFQMKFLGQIANYLAEGAALYLLLYGAMILFFSYFWVATQFNELQIADDLKKHGGYIPGVRPGKPVIRPLVPPTWRWVGLRRVPYHGGMVSYFAVRQQDRMHVYASADVESDYEPHVYKEDVTSDVIVMSKTAAVIALRSDTEVLIMIGNVGSQTATAPLDISGVIDRGAKYELRMYNSERDDWVDGATLSGAEISSVAVPIELYGFRLIDLKRC